MRDRVAGPSLSLYELVARARGWLAQVTYRPNVRMEVAITDPYDDLVLLLHYEVEDTYNPGHVGNVTHRYPLDFRQIEDRAWFIDHLRHCIHQTEMHEADEWLKDVLTGRPIFDPHKRRP